MIALLVGAAAAAPLYSGAASPWTVGDGDLYGGLFRPWSYGLSDTTQIQTQGLVSLLAPNVQVKHSYAGDDFGVAALATLSVPTLGYRKLQSWTLPSSEPFPWSAVVGVGGIVGWRTDQLVVSASALARVGLAAGGDFPFDSPDFPYLDPLLAPLTEGWGLRTALAIDLLPSQDWVVNTEVSVAFPAGPDVHSKLFVLRSLSEHWAVGAGGAYALETFDFGTRAQPVAFLDVTPLLDVQGRW